MKKKGLILVLGTIFLASGLIIFQMQSKNKEIVSEKPEVVILSKDEAKSLVNDLVKNIINVYENINETFNVEEVESDELNDYIKVTNYDEIVKKIFTENGIEEFENVNFNGKKFVKKEDDSVYLLKELPENNRYIESSISSDTFNITEKEITCEVTLSTNTLLDDDMLTYYIIVKNIKLIKSGNNWLVDTFSYNN